MNAHIFGSGTIKIKYINKRSTMEIKTSRLTICDLSVTDWMEMKNIFIDFNCSPYAIYDRPLPVKDEDAKALTKQFAGSKLFFAVYLSGKMIGYVGFHKVGDEYDLGYCFHSSYQGNGYAYESVKALLDYFTKEYHAAKFTAGTALENEPSCNLLRKLGFLCVSTETVCFDGNFSFQGGNFELKSIPTS